MVISKLFFGRYKLSIINLKFDGICGKLCFLGRRNNRIVINLWIEGVVV